MEKGKENKKKKTVTIKEIAEKAGVSIATVSYIVNGKGKSGPETTERVMKVINELHYVPNAAARQLKTKKTKTIGVIVEDMTIFSIPDIVDGITDYCNRMHYQILLMNLRLFKNYDDTYYYKDFYYEQVHHEIRKLLNLQVCGIIYVTAHERVLKCIPEDLSVPALMAYGYTESRVIPSVVVDDEDGEYQLTKKLIDNGHKKIGMITGKVDSMHMQARLMGFQKALYESHVLLQPGNVKTGDWTRKSGYNCTDELLSNGVTAIMCMNDLMAGGVYDRLFEKNIVVGKDIAVVGYDNRDVSSYYKPALTTMKLPLHDIGYKAGEILLKMIEHPEEEPEKPEVYPVKCEMIEGGSVTTLNSK